MIADEQTITSERITQMFNDLVRPIRDWFEQVTPEPTSAVAWFLGYSALVPRRVDTIPQSGAPIQGAYARASQRSWPSGCGGDANTSAVAAATVSSQVLISNGLARIGVPSLSRIAIRAGSVRSGVVVR